MEKRFTSEFDLIKPTINGVLKLHHVCEITNRKTGEKLVVRCEVISMNVYLLNVVKKSMSGYAPTQNWIQLTHEDYCNDYFLSDAITAKEELDRLSVEFTPASVKY